MADELLAALLQKAQGIGAAPPAEMQGPRDLLNGGVDAFKGFTGLGDQGPAGPTATNFGQLLGAAMPLAGGLKKLAPVVQGSEGSIQEMLQNIWRGVSHHDPLIREGEKDLPQYAAPLVELLNDYRAEEPSLQNLLASRATPRMGLKPQMIKAPEGFTFGYARSNNYDMPASPNTKRYQDYRSKVPLSSSRKDQTRVMSVTSPEELRDLRPSEAAPQGKTPIHRDSFQTRQVGAQQTKLKKSGLDEASIRQIRQIGKAPQAKKAFPNVSYDTIASILKGDSFNWVK